MYPSTQRITEVLKASSRPKTLAIFAIGGFMTAGFLGRYVSLEMYGKQRGLRMERGMIHIRKHTIYNTLYDINSGEQRVGFERTSCKSYQGVCYLSFQGCGESHEEDAIFIFRAMPVC